MQNHTNIWSLQTPQKAHDCMTAWLYCWLTPYTLVNTPVCTAPVFADSSGVVSAPLVLAGSVSTSLPPQTDPVVACYNPTQEDRNTEKYAMLFFFFFKFKTSIHYLKIATNNKESINLITYCHSVKQLSETPRCSVLTRHCLQWLNACVFCFKYTTWSVTRPSYRACSASSHSFCSLSLRVG